MGPELSACSALAVQPSSLVTRHSSLRSSSVKCYVPRGVDASGRQTGTIIANHGSGLGGWDLRFTICLICPGIELRLKADAGRACIGSKWPCSPYACMHACMQVPCARDVPSKPRPLLPRARAPQCVPLADSIHTSESAPASMFCAPPKPLLRGQRGGPQNQTFLTRWDV